MKRFLPVLLLVSFGCRTVPTTSGQPTPSATPDSEVTITDIPELPGSRLFVRGDITEAPGIVLLHGSEGGQERYIDYDARPLAEAGFVVVTLCWFDCEGRPDIIHRVPLEYTRDAIEWLGGQELTGSQPVALFGVSRGAEQAVLLASLVKSTDLIAAVAVHAPSDTVVASYDPSTGMSVPETDPDTGETIYGAAWTWEGEPLYGETAPPFGSGPRILVEDYPGAMYLSHGTNDMLWPVQRSKNIQATRDDAGLETEAHYWEGEGHILQQTQHVEEFLDTLTQFFDRELR